MSLQGKKVLVVGTGKSGIAATELLCANGIDTVLFDGNKELDSKTLYEKAPKLKEVPLILGDLTDEQIDEFDVAEEAAYDLVRTKHFTVKPMSTEEAILQMNLLDHSFYVFRNSDDDSISIVYHRKNGGYGLIVTDEEE